ncbi:MAG: class II fumarate hydratase [Desulfobacterales bacterium]|nr:MAG: class II fumarate hydratase [Desulfobacterales bacterium]
MNFREEKDTMGTVRVPEEAYYGPQTQRALENFSISGLTLPPVFIHALALIKQCSAKVNKDLEGLDRSVAAAITDAAQEVMDGIFDDQFVVDIFQTGSGTSTNMNMNEVIAARANEMMTGKKGGKAPVHPNDHVNLGQSSNDVIPSAIHVSALISIRDRLLPSLQLLHATLLQKAEEFVDIQKIGRTHLQDAVPMTLGQEFSGYARQIELGRSRIIATEERLSELAIGGTAVGTGLNTHPEFGARVVDLISAYTHLPFKEAENHFEAQAARDAVVETSGALKTIAVGLVKIANDIRWLASGPRCGIGEIHIPSLQPGSSIMPGKVNPVIPEAVIQVAAQIMGNDTTIMMGGQSGNFELNVTLPVVAYNLLQSIHLLAAATETFARKCLSGTLANREQCAAYIEKSLALSTGLVPHIGYDRAAAIAKKASETGRTIREIASMEGVLSKDVLDQVFGKLKKDG